MTRLPLLVAVLSLSLAACDAAAPPEPSADQADGTGGAVYRTPGTDYPGAAARLPDGSVVVGALTEGAATATDGTAGYPAVVRFDREGGLLSAEVYRDGERDGFGVGGVAPLGGGLAVAVSERGRAAVYRTDASGRGRRRVFETEAGASVYANALVAVAGGVALTTSPWNDADPDVYALDAGGGVRWTYRQRGAARAVGAAPDGGLFVVGSAAGGGADVVRLGPDGTERWRRRVADVDARLAAVVEGGVAVAFYRTVAAPGDDASGGLAVEVRVVRLDGDGRTVSDRAVATLPTAEGVLRPTAVAGLPSGAVAVALAQRAADGVPTRAWVQTDDPAGRPVAAGDAERSTVVTHLLPVGGRRLVAVSAVGSAAPGDDDIDVAVSAVSL